MDLYKVNTHNINVVPWINRLEWKYVYEQLFSTTDSMQQRKQTLQHLNIWKGRVNMLPSGIEGTIILLEAIIRDEDSRMSEEESRKRKEESSMRVEESRLREEESHMLDEEPHTTFSTTKLQQAHSFTIMRFLNICVTSRVKQGDFRSSAIALGVPPWIIEIRNDIAHDQQLPSLICLRQALRKCFNWLKECYWDEEYSHSNEYLPKAMDIDRLKALIQVYFNVLTPGYDHHQFADLLITLQVEKPITKRNIREVTLAEIELSLPLPTERLLDLCSIVLQTFQQRYMNNEQSAQKLSFTILDELIKFMDVNEVLYSFIEALISSIKKNILPSYVLTFYSNLLNRVFCSLQMITVVSIIEASNTPKKSNSLIHFTTINTLNRSQLQSFFYESARDPNVYVRNYIGSLFIVAGFNLEFTKKLLDVMELVINGPKVISKPLHIPTEVTKEILSRIKSNTIENKPETVVNVTRENITGSTIWSIVEDTSTFRNCPLGVLPEDLKGDPRHLYENVLNQYN